MKCFSILLAGLLAIGCASAVRAQQCAAPTSVTTSLSNITCRGSGKIVITAVQQAGGSSISTDSCNYSLYNAANTTMLRPEQSSNTFTGLDSGTYNLRVRRICSNPSGISDYYSTPVNLTGYYVDPFMSTPTINNPTNSCSHDGNITAAAVTGGLGPYTYCLVDSMTAVPLPSHYVAAPQSSPVFSGLDAGIYYLRVYDACGASLTRQATLTTTSQPVLGSVSMVRLSCDTVEMRVGVFPYTTYNTLQRSWVTYPNGTTDTVNMIYNNYSYIPYKISWSVVTGDSATLTFGYKDICGNTQTVSKTVKRPVFYMKPSFTASNYNCTTGYFVPGYFASGSNNMSLQDSSSNNYATAEKYYYDSYSTDSGATWKPYNINDTIFVTDGSSIKLSFKWCGQIYTTVLSAAAQSLSLHLWTYNKLACAGKSGIYIHKPFGYTGNIDSVLVQVIARPAGQDSIPPFYDNWDKYQGSIPQMLNLVAGSYTLKFTDQCSSYTGSITIGPNPYSKAVIKSRFNCDNTVNLFLADSTAYTSSSITPWWRRYFTVYNSSGVNVYSYSYPYANEGYTIGTWTPNLPPDTYTIRTWKAGGYGIGSTGDTSVIVYATDTACGADTITVDAHMPSALSLKNVLFSTCSNDTLLGDIIAMPTGGIGSYSYTLYHDSIGAATLVSGPQANNIFSGLIANKVYVISVMDQCGSSSPAISSLANVRPVTATSTNIQPCIGDGISLSVDSMTGLTYQWSLNGVNIPGATHTAYTITSMTAADSGQYVAHINAGSCLLLASPVVLDPTQCGNVILPLDLLRFSGSVNMQHNAVLHWDIAKAEQGGKFEILYSVDGSRFSKAGTMLQDGIATSFNFLHAGYKVTSKTYYKLLQTDVEGQQHYSNIIVLNSSAIASNQLEVAPVPFSDYLNISYSAVKDDKVQLTVSDISGRVIKTQSITINKGINSIHIDQLNAISRGTYLLSVTASDGSRQTLKIQK